jgi:small subunit ribosomal protein S9
MTVQYFEGIGRRKESIARVRVMKGSGNFVINTKALNDYFPRIGDPEAILAPPQALGEDRAIYDVQVVVKGGGITGQSVAVQLGLARALTLMNPEARPALRQAGLLTRDARIKERKKPGLKRARKAPTYTKR